jgi:molybdenum cofactor cytidylyltransferase
VIAGLVLAAGLSTRMGRPKLLLDWGGSPVIRRVVEGVLAAGLDDVLVVVGPSAAELAAALAGLPVRLIVNPHPEAGQAGSLVTGVRALSPGTRAVVVALGDQPTLPAGAIPALLSAFGAGGGPVLAPSYRGGRGHPVLFASALFPELLALAGDRGAREVVDRDPARVTLVPLDVPMPEDLDTPEDYERLRPPPGPV